MATTDTPDDPDRCVALTSDGERCSRPAQDDGFCFQHDGRDPTIDGTGADDDGDAAADEDAAVDGDGGRDAADEEAATADGGEDAVDPSPADDDVPAIVAVRRSVERAAEAVIGRPLDGVLEVSPDDGGWRVEVEVVERAAVPDTQDILGRYEIEVDENARVSGYRRLERYRRGDTSPSQPT